MSFIQKLLHEKKFFLPRPISIDNNQLPIFVSSFPYFKRRWRICRLRSSQFPVYIRTYLDLIKTPEFFDAILLLCAGMLNPWRVKLPER